MEFSLLAVGDQAVKVQFIGKVSPMLNKKMKAFCRELANSAIEGIVEWVPAFDSVTIYYLPERISYKEICEKINGLALSGWNETDTPSRLVHVPVLYGGEFGPDLGRVAEHNKLSESDVIAIHQQPKYLVYMLGFLPGFPYLGGMDSKIATPRLDEPRRSTFAGAVGIAHEQTGIYPVESPGGWNIIGKTPLKLFDSRNGEFLLHPGNYVQFYSVVAAEFAEIEMQVVRGTYELIIENC